MAKQSKNFKYSLIFQTVNSELSEILDKCNNGKAVESLRDEDRRQLWDILFTLVKGNNQKELTEENSQILKNCIDLILNILTNGNLKLENNHVLVNIIKFLNSNEFLSEESALINSISKVNEFWMVKMQNSEEIPGMEYLTVKHLLNLCTSDKLLMADIQRLSAIRKVVTANPFDKAVPSLRSLLIKLVQKVQVLNSEHGQRFLAQTIILSQKIMTEVHKTIMLDLSSCNKSKASDYGKIYVMAWHGASEELKGALVKNCFQHIMETFLKENRTSLELSKKGQNILTVLEVWHSERKKKHPDFITMMTNAYQPILWKYLHSGFNVHRCNATDVFFKAFPLQRSNDNAEEAEEFFNMQFKAMLGSLTDDCHIVRIIATREICNILAHYWNSFNPLQIQSLMTVITKRNANDASSAEARRMVYIGFQSLVKSPLSCEYIKQILPNLANNIHDVNQRVRTAFIQLLICIKEKKDPTFKYTDIVSMFNLQYRLAEDNIAVGHGIVKLLMKNYYHSKMSVVEWTKRFIYLIKTYRNSYRNFFFYSSKSLPFVDACTIIREILTQVGVFVISRMEEENNENVVQKSEETRKKGKKAPLSDWNGSKESSQSNTGIIKKCAFDDPEVISGLIDIATILWVLHNVKLHKPENEELRFKLYDTYIKYAQAYINYYKDSNLFLGIISLSGNIPASLLRNNSITLPGYCLKMLKSIKMDRSDEDNDRILSMIIALVKWGKGSEILEQVTLWLDAAFETQNMNETILPRRRVKISESIQPNSVIAIHILDTLLKKEYVKLSIFKKNYHELFHLWKFMSRIRQLIETRFDQGEQFAEDLVSDQFLTLCFRRYVKLIPLLKENGKTEEEKKTEMETDRTDTETVAEELINRQKEMENVVEWGNNLLFPMLQQEELKEDEADLACTILEDILYVSDNMIIVHLVNNLFYLKTAHFALKLLNTSYGIRFVKASSRIATALNHSAKLLFKVNDDLRIFSTVVPSILSHSLNVLTNRKFSTKEIEKLEKDLPTIKSNYGKILATYEDNLKSTNKLRENVRHLKLVVSLFLDCIVALISQDIPRQDDSIPLYTSPSQLPRIANVFIALFHNKKTWTSLFIHVINSKLSMKDCNVKLTVSCILLLHMYAASDKKINEVELKKALDAALKNLIRMKESIEKKDKPMEGNAEKNTVEKKSGEEEAMAMDCSTNGTELANQENISKEVNIPDKKTEGSEIILEEKSLNLSSFRTERNNLEMDFINCGIEIIKNTQNALENQPAET